MDTEALREGVREAVRELLPDAGRDGVTDLLAVADDEAVTLGEPVCRRKYGKISRAMIETALRITAAQS